MDKTTNETRAVSLLDM